MKRKKNHQQNPKGETQTREESTKENKDQQPEKKRRVSRSSEKKTSSERKNGFRIRSQDENVPILASNLSLFSNEFIKKHNCSYLVRIGTMSCPLPCSFSHCSSRVVSSALESTCTATVVMAWPKESKIYRNST